VFRPLGIASFGLMTIVSGTMISEKKHSKQNNKGQLVLSSKSATTTWLAILDRFLALWTRCTPESEPWSVRDENSLNATPSVRRVSRTFSLDSTNSWHFDTSSVSRSFVLVYTVESKWSVARGNARTSMSNVQTTIEIHEVAYRESWSGLSASHCNYLVLEGCRLSISTMYTVAFSLFPFLFFCPDRSQEVKGHFSSTLCFSLFEMQYECRPTQIIYRYMYVIVELRNMHIDLII
jgi:hypothetical protein